MQGNNSLEGTPNVSPIHSPDLNRRLAELAEHQNENEANEIVSENTENNNESLSVDNENSAITSTNTNVGSNNESTSEVNQDESVAQDNTDQVDASEADGINADDASRSEAITELIIDENHFSSPVQNRSLMGSPVIARRTRFGSNNASEDYYNSEVRSLQTRQHNLGIQHICFSFASYRYKTWV